MSLQSRGVTFGDSLVIPSSRELAMPSSPPCWRCSAPLWLHGNMMVSPLMDSDAQKDSLWGWMKHCANLPGPFLWAFSKAKVGFYCWSLADALAFPRATFWGDGWLVLAGAGLFLAYGCSDLGCLRVCVRLGIRAALMSALIHLKAAQDGFVQSPWGACPEKGALEM